MSLALCSQLMFQAPQHFRFSETCWPSRQANWTSWPSRQANCICIGWGVWDPCQKRMEVSLFIYRHALCVWLTTTNSQLKRKQKSMSFLLFCLDSSLSRPCMFPSSSSLFASTGAFWQMTKSNSSMPPSISVREFNEPMPVSAHVHEVSSVQSLVWVGQYRNMTDDSAEIVFQSFLQEAHLSSSVMSRDGHSLMLPIQHFLCQLWCHPPSKVPWRMVLGRLCGVWHAELCQFPSLDSCQKKFLLTHKEVDLALHPVLDLVLQVDA